MVGHIVGGQQLVIEKGPGLHAQLLYLLVHAFLGIEAFLDVCVILHHFLDRRGIVILQVSAQHKLHRRHGRLVLRPSAFIRKIGEIGHHCHYQHQKDDRYFCRVF